MKVMFYCEENEEFTPLGRASALINGALEGVTDHELAEVRKQELAEIAEYIQIFCKYNKGVS